MVSNIVYASKAIIKTIQKKILKLLFLFVFLKNKKLINIYNKKRTISRQVVRKVNIQQEFLLIKYTVKNVGK